MQLTVFSAPLDFLQPPLFGRKAFEREIVQLHPRVVNDDVITFNTQGSSQWDGFRHVAYRDEEKFYNGVTPDEIYAAGATVNGVEAWAKRGIAGRGVLIDYHSWAQRNGVEYNRLDSHGVKLDEIKAILEESKIELRQGDIFIMRTGFTEAYARLSAKEKEDYKTNVRFPGIAQGLDVAKWLWEQQFSAVAGDTVAFECFRKFILLSICR